jgi:hypothetical protein
MRRFLAVQLLCVALACSSSGGNNNDAAGAAGASGSGGAGGTSAGGTSGSAGTTSSAGTTGSSGRGGTSAGTGGSGGSGVRCLAFDSPGLTRGTACPNTSPPCYAACDFDGDQYVGCITGSTEYSECFGSCGSCP